MKTLNILLIAMVLTSCSKVILEEEPLGYSVMPEYLDIDSIAPFNLNDTNRVVDSSYEYFKSIALDGGWLKISPTDSINLPPGILISDRTAALSIFYKASWIRQKEEMKYRSYLMREYYDKAIEAEKLYQKEIVRLENLSKRTWLEKNMGYIGFGAGLASSILFIFALSGSLEVLN